MTELELQINLLIERRPPLVNKSDDLYAEKLERLVQIIPRLIKNRYAGTDTYFDGLDAIEEEVATILKN